jgi:hypothetical protein
LGRAHQIPWCLPRLQRLLNYMSPSDSIMLPPAHMLLRGLLRDLVAYALKTKLKNIGRGSPARKVVLDSASRKRLAVRVCSCTRLQASINCISVGCTAAYSHECLYSAGALCHRIVAAHQSGSGRALARFKMHGCRPV